MISWSETVHMSVIVLHCLTDILQSSEVTTEAVQLAIIVQVDTAMTL